MLRGWLASPIIGAAVSIIDPNDGLGWSETIVAILVIVGYFVIIVKDGNAPTELVSLLTLIAGFYFGTRVKEKKKEN